MDLLYKMWIRKKYFQILDLEAVRNLVTLRQRIVSMI